MVAAPALSLLHGVEGWQTLLKMNRAAFSTQAFSAMKSQAGLLVMRLLEAIQVALPALWGSHRSTDL